MIAEIITIGTELLLGEITDTNATFLASQLPPLGIDLYWVSQVGDDRVRLTEALQHAWERSDLILTTGGLGPTEDDLTREAIGGMLGENPAIDPSLETRLRARFIQRGMAMPLSNLKQATLIPSAEPINNELGTAPGWWVQRGGHILVALPGPPREMQPMWQQEVQPRLRQKSETIILSKTLKTFGLSEAVVGELAFPLFSSNNPSLGVYAKTDGIHLRLTAKAKSQKQTEEMIAEGETSIRAALGEYIWGTDNDTLEAVVAHLLIKRGLSLAVMEDYSGGDLAARITDIPGSQAFFKGGLVACTSETKTSLGVDARLIMQYGAISPEVAQAMAVAARGLLHADIGVGVTGIEETANPTGLVYIGIGDDKSAKIANSRVLSRAWGKQRVTTAVLFELRKLLIDSD